MDNNQNISEGISSNRITADDDVEGHAARGKAIDGPDADDVEGHGARANFALPREADVEGHAARGKAIDGPDTDDDVEGHAAKIRI